MILDYLHGPNLTTWVLRSTEALLARSRERAVTALEGQRDAICLSFKVEGNEPRNVGRKPQKTDSPPGPPGGTQPLCAFIPGSEIQQHWEPKTKSDALLPVPRPVCVPFLCFPP